jgi:hypothetical protein
MVGQVTQGAVLELWKFTVASPVNSQMLILQGSNPGFVVLVYLIAL